MSEIIKAWRIKSDLSVAEVTLTRIGEQDNVGLTFWKPKRGVGVVIDREHSDYFSDEATAHDIAYGRASYAETKTYNAHVEAKNRAKKALIARTMFRNRDK